MGEISKNMEPVITFTLVFTITGFLGGKMRLVFDIIYPASFLQQCLNCVAAPAYTTLLQQRLWIYIRAKQKTAANGHGHSTQLPEEERQRIAALRKTGTYWRDKTGFCPCSHSEEPNQCPTQPTDCGSTRSRSQPLSKVV